MIHHQQKNHQWPDNGNLIQQRLLHAAKLQLFQHIYKKDTPKDIHTATAPPHQEGKKHVSDTLAAHPYPFQKGTDNATHHIPQNKSQHPQPTQITTKHKHTFEHLQIKN
jgi:hypothetical protein